MHMNSLAEIAALAREIFRDLLIIAACGRYLGFW